MLQITFYLVIGYLQFFILFLRYEDLTGVMLFKKCLRAHPLKKARRFGQWIGFHFPDMNLGYHFACQ